MLQSVGSRRVGHNLVTEQKVPSPGTVSGALSAGHRGSG